MENIFRDAHEAAQIKQKKQENLTPYTAEFHGEEKPMTHRDFFVSMRANIQEQTNKDDDFDAEQIKQINELLSPELMLDYKKILLEFKKKAVKNEEHPQRELIDIDNEDFRNQIDEWIGKLKTEILSKKTDTNDQFEELEMSCVLFFDSMARVFNTRSIDLDIKDLIKEKGISFSYGNRGYKLEQIGKQLMDKYKISEAEAEILIELNLAEEHQFNMLEVLKMLSGLWKEYELGNKKGHIAKISAGYISSRVMRGWAPSSLAGLLKGSSFDLSVLMEFIGAERTSFLLDAKTEQELNKLMHEISVQINERVTDSLFFQEFEFIHGNKMGEFFTTLENGKRSTLNLLRTFISEFAPTCITLGSSMAFLTKINPILGGISLASLPMAFNVAKAQHKKVSGIYQQERRKDAEIRNQIDGVKSGFEEIRISPNISDVANLYGDNLTQRDNLLLERNNKIITHKELFKLPYDLTTIGTTIVSYLLQQRGEISQGAVLSNFIYSQQLQQPINQLVASYFNSISYDFYDIQRMNKLLGEYEKFDLPEGEKESSRIPVSDLNNYNISIKNLSFKNILRGLNHEIEQGSLVTISGESGVGKTTLLRNITGLFKPDRGQIEIGGIPMDKIKRYGEKSLYTKLAYCNQSPIFFDTMTLRENLILWTKQQPNDEKIKEVLNRLGLEKFSNSLGKEINYLSGGERVRMGIARMLLKNPKIILLDEPTSSLDSKSAEEVRKIISELHSNNPDVTILCVSHDEKLLQMGDGKIQLD